jgi:hypothetical protein
MKRTLAIIAAICFVAVSLAAQTAPKKVLTGKDIDAFVANFDKIEEELEALGDKYDDYFKTGVEPEDSQMPSPGKTIALMRAKEVPAEVKSVFKRHGLGDNGFEKMIVISAGFGALEMESAIKSQEQEYAEFPDMATYLEAAKSQVAELKSSIHKDDLSLVSSRADELRVFFADESEESDE